MERRANAEWVRIRQRRVIDDGEYYAERLYETRQAATSYAREAQRLGKEVLVLPTASEGGHRGYAVFVER
ncbi:hypothetical protein F8E02_03485 [Methanoculleus sp. Wushi-C6]|uniref:Uncharacterized protein n=1 Tax=Methanoculleus caldifontis TaxID=2651577 RepID=A0ABU3X0X2_9EURY|nr:hypothetical protein [Methanoculleus sp. Wushi-C6]MDV2481086.1 hypothetical protein [Methanoculleus sp. Wushi-C6]